MRPMKSGHAEWDIGREKTFLTGIGSYSGMKGKLVRIGLLRGYIEALSLPSTPDSWMPEELEELRIYAEDQLAQEEKRLPNEKL